MVTGEDPYEQNAEGTFAAFDRLVDYYLAKNSGKLYVGECGVPADLTDEIKEKALGLARSLVN